MPEISDERLDELLAAAGKATPGPWYHTGAPWFRDATGVLAGSPDGNVAFLIADTDDFALPRDEYEGFPLGDKEADAAYIAKLDPTTISTLIAEVKAARAGKGVGEPDYWAVWSKSGAHIGLWKDKETAERVAGEYTKVGAYVQPLFSALPSLEPQGAQEAVAWEGIQPNGITSDITRKKAKAEMWVHNGWVVRPLYASPTGNSEHGGVSEEAVEMARHWIDRYAAGIDEEPQMRRIVAALTAASVQQGKGADDDEAHATLRRAGPMYPGPIVGNHINGDIYGDKKGRFDDGTNVTTSKVKEVRGDLLVTANSIYRVEWSSNVSDRLPTPPSIPGDGR